PVAVTINDHSFRTTGGTWNLGSTQHFTVLGPTGALADPADGSSLGGAAIGNRGYLDVAFVAPRTTERDLSTGPDVDPESTRSGYTGTFTIDTTKAPVFIGKKSANTWVFRYWTVGTYVSGSVQIAFTPGSYGFTNSTTSTFVGPVAPENFLVDGVATPNIHWL